MRTFRSLFAVLSLAFLAGCASVPMTSSSLDADAKAFVPVPGKAAVYVNRDGWIGTAVVVQIVFDGRIVGSLPGRTYMIFNAEPGQHVLSASGMGTFGHNTEQVEINAEAGKRYFFKVTARAHLTPLDEAEGKRRLMKSKRAEALS